jgi:glucose/arabinose dehydrogenase
MAIRCSGAIAVMLVAAACGAGAGDTVAHSAAASTGRSQTAATTAATTTTAATATTATPAARTPTAVAGSSLPRVQVRLSVPAGNGAGVFSRPRTLTVPRGWKAEVWARVENARFMAWTPQHTLLVSAPGDTVVELTPAADPASPPRQQVLLSGLTQPQGLAFDTIGGQTVLYVAESDQIDRYVWLGDAGVGARTVIVDNLPDLDPRGDDVHRVKTLVVGRDHRIYIDIGSAFNASRSDIAGHPPRGSIVSYAPDGSDMRVVATGVRNGEGLSFAPNGVLWSAVNERDSIAYPFPGRYGSVAHAYGQVIQSYVNNHPPDELIAVTPGRNVGWPYCNPDASHGMANMSFDNDAQTNPGGRWLDCAKLTPINRGVAPHSAPLGFHFLEGSSLPVRFTGGAVLAVHGSWDREPPRPPAVLWVPWSNARQTLGAPITLISGFQLPNGSRWGRAADAVPGPDGSLYVSDDTAGAIYRITP